MLSEFEFTVRYRTDTAWALRQLQAACQPGVLVSVDGGELRLRFVREAESIDAARAAAMEQLRAALQG